MIIRSTVDKLKLKNATYIDGLDILGSFSLLSADKVHPNIHGVQQIADRLTGIIGQNRDIRSRAFEK